MWLLYNKTSQRSQSYLHIQMFEQVKLRPEILGRILHTVQDDGGGARPNNKLTHESLFVQSDYFLFPCSYFLEIAKCTLDAESRMRSKKSTFRTLPFILFFVSTLSSVFEIAKCTLGAESRMRRRRRLDRLRRSRGAPGRNRTFTTGSEDQDSIH